MNQKEDTTPTIPENVDRKSMVARRRKPETRTPCGYRPGLLKASDGTRYVVEDSGQIRRLERKMSKAERKRHKKARRAEARKNS